MPNKDWSEWTRVCVYRNRGYTCYVRGCHNNEVIMFERCGREFLPVCGKHYDGSGLCFMCNERFTRAKHNGKFRCVGCGGSKNERERRQCSICKVNPAKRQGKCSTCFRTANNGCDICFTSGGSLVEVPRKHVVTRLFSVKERYPQAFTNKVTLTVCRGCVKTLPAFTLCCHPGCDLPRISANFRCAEHGSARATRATRTVRMCSNCGVSPREKDRTKCSACRKTPGRNLTKDDKCDVCHIRPKTKKRKMCATCRKRKRPDPLSLHKTQKRSRENADP